jgi:hypothetical protein
MDTSMNDGALSTYSDAGQVDAWAKEVMVWATNKGIFHGDQNGYLNPQGLVTRAQTAQILQNLSPILTDTRYITFTGDLKIIAYTKKARCPMFLWDTSLFYADLIHFI